MKLYKILLFTILALAVINCKNDDDRISLADADSDSIIDLEDNCPNTPNTAQVDSDEDGIGDVCDEDVDGDGVPNSADNCPDISNPDQADDDNDGIGNVCDDGSSYVPLAPCDNGFAGPYPCNGYDLMLSLIHI